MPQRNRVPPLNRPRVPDEFDGYAQRGWPPAQLFALVRILAA